jgi:hypothetical protein
MWGNPLPWQKTSLTPNLGKIDSTEDMRPGLGFEGVARLKEFVEQGGLLIASEDTAQFAIEDGIAFTVSNLAVNRSLLTEKEYKRPTGRGGPDDADTPEGRPVHDAPGLPSPKPWQATPLNEEQERNNPYLIPEQYRPDVIFRYADAKGLLISGLLYYAIAIAELPLVVDAHLGKGNVLLFANNPVYRGETIGSYALVFNAIINFDHLASAAPVGK